MGEARGEEEGTEWKRAESGERQGRGNRGRSAQGGKDIRKANFKREDFSAATRMRQVTPLARKQYNKYTLLSCRAHDLCTSEKTPSLPIL